MNPFTFVNAINYDKTDVFEDPQAESAYVPFVINRSLSYFADTIFFANEVNRYNQIAKRWQFDFLRHGIPKKKRFSKWAKKDDVANLDLVCEFYKYSKEKGIQALSILTQQQIDAIRCQMDRGGNNEHRSDLL